MHPGYNQIQIFHRYSKQSGFTLSKSGLNQQRITWQDFTRGGWDGSKRGKVYPGNCQI